MIVELVTFRIKSGKEQDFEAHSQEWSRLLRRTRGYIGQVMMRSLADPAEYHVEVRWVSQDYRDRFSSRDDADKKSLEKKGAALLEAPPSHRLLECV